jgi:NAD(P)-dependent dehydrogenase (short-subunit alcohol dehydrogenase family)
MIWITGANGGVGSELARHLAGDGHTLVLTGRNAIALADLQKSLPRSEEHRVLVADLTQPGDWEKELEQYGAELKGLAHCVGSVMIKPLHRTTFEDWRQQMSVNADSAFLVLKAWVQTRVKVRQGGSAVLFGSLICDAGFAAHEAVGASKGAVVALAQSAAASYAAQQIRVNSILPGLTRTPLAAKFLATEAAEQRMAQMNPLGRVGEAKDPAALAAFLLSDASSFITGQSFAVDGGQALLHLPPKL